MPNAPIPTGAPGSALKACLAAVALVAVVGPAWIVATSPRIAPHRVRPMPHFVVPKAEIPPVEPVAFQNLAPDDARAFNASIPFVDGPVPAARPFHFAGSDDEAARARDCLATAVLFEAGDDSVGERAVAQVVINRARHPAFPKTICGVVFQGSERSTGCQFTFTCDGALANHRWSDAAWSRARAVATAALSGTVYRPVGYATHYHTDWVVPYWQSSLDKIAAVHTHLFFRWTGWWGTGAAFNRQVSSDEPVIPALAALSDAHKTGAALADADSALAQAALATATATGAPPIDGQDGSFILKLDAHSQPDLFAAIATRACGERPYCKVMGWTDKAKMPAALPLTPEQVGTMSFSYLRDRAHNFDKALWNCAQFKRADKSQCMKLQILTPVVRPPLATAPDAVTTAKRSEPLAPRPRIETYRLQVLPGTHGATPPPVVPTLHKPAATATTPPTDRATPEGR